MKIKIRDIGVDGKHLEAQAAETPWLDDALGKGLAELYHTGDAGRLTVDLLRIGETVQVNGEMAMTIHPFCGRCAESFPMPLRVDIKRVMVPRPATLPHASQEDQDAELNVEDIDFSFYVGDTFEIDPIVQEELLLALPLVFLCRPECRGLCPTCGANLNLGACPCKKNIPPFGKGGEGGF